MAASRLFVTVYRHMALDDFNRLIAAPMTPPLDEFYLEIGPESSVSDPFPQYATFISVKPEVDCALAFGEEPVADPDFHRLDAGEKCFYGVREGHRIAVISIAPEIEGD